MAEVTVCIPAHHSGNVIAETLASVRAQSFTDFVVDIGLEPENAASVEGACRPFLEDHRFRQSTNLSTLGYDRNIRSLLQRVATPYFVILPHDDLWHSRYLESLLEVLRPRSDASVAYSEMFVFGNVSGALSDALPDAGVRDRLLTFFLDGAEPTPWHGLTRTTTLRSDFPCNDFSGFAVECEWALHLIREGVALHVPEPLYLKRSRANTGVAWGWSSWPAETKVEAIEHHRRVMLAAIEDAQLEADSRDVIVMAAEAAILRRWFRLTAGRSEVPPDMRDRADAILRATAGSSDPVYREIACRTLLSLSRAHHGRGERAESKRLAVAAVEASPHHWEACLHLARLLAEDGHPSDAILMLKRADASIPLALGGREIQALCSGILGGKPAASQLSPVRIARAPDGPRPQPRRPGPLARLKPRLLAARMRARDLPGARMVGALVVNPLFDAEWYVAAYADAPSGRDRAYRHFRTRGIREGRDPNPFFDTDWYLEQNPDVVTRGRDPLDHFLVQGGQEGRDPSPRFDAGWYLRTNPDVRASGVNPLLHYLRHGRAEGRRPRPDASTSAPASGTVLPQG